MKLTRKRLAKLHTPPISLDEALFGPELAPTVALGIRRQQLMNEFRAIMDDWNESNPVKLVNYLVEAHTSYNPEIDGPSPIMMLIGKCIEHCKAEKYARNSGVVAQTESH